MARYLNAAALTKDPIERMKLVMVASVCFMYCNHSWGKPLNPILGETYQAFAEDGTIVSVEQISHHPPVSYLLMEGPNNLYRFSGYSDFAIKAWINSITLDVGGVKKVAFPDGTEIEFTN
eukprot:CAMPEP_0170480892 /NCGR_PEP_ID=MMETSP0208-20121228/1550_1 /TAXON_ID=197538 /ORGANISM="Strombidium inclinatum, Strain S3" /LENGTH=119 /DNA_ID=CAMNT_0010753507 /DNA_START=1849 /DNA_END=2208 /DNA_ORIENTATION=-